MKRSDVLRVIKVVLDSYVRDSIEDNDFMAELILTDLEEIVGMLPPFEYDFYRERLPELAENLDRMEGDLLALHKWDHEG